MLVDTGRGDEVLDEVTFGRSRALAVIGALIFSAAATIAAPRLARAADGLAPWPCAGLGACHCCSGTSCCEAGCSWDFSHSHCSSGGQCWFTCTGCPGDYYECCDWHTTLPGFHACICRAFLGQCQPC